MTRDQVEQAVLTAIESLNETMPTEQQIGRTGDASLLDLDSLAITNLIITVEDAVQEQLDVTLVLTDERTLDLLADKDRSPLRNVATLVEHVLGALKPGAE